MHGNVWEWCEDDFHENYINAPACESAWTCLTSGNTKLLRGGSWNSVAQQNRSAYRNWYSRYHRYYEYGFRVVFS